MHMLVTRPQPDADAQAARLQELGHEATVAPLLEIRFEDMAARPPDRTQAIVITSRNALRAMQASAALDSIRDKPLFAVGEATARLARELGFAKVRAGSGTAEALAPVLVEHCDPSGGILYHPAGEALAWDLKGALEAKGFEIVQPVVYRAVAVRKLPENAVAAIQRGMIGGVILMSPETARTYARCIRDAQLEAQARLLAYYCLSASVAAQLEPLSRVDVHVPAAVTQDDLLALIGRVTAN